MSSQVMDSPEKPQNGIAGLKHFRHDLLSGIVVSLVSLPLSSGIAIASGAPPIVGLISAIIAGLVFPLIGGAYVTIAGPAAGLAPAVMAIMVSFGGAGDAETLGEGYRFLLVVIFLVGCFQIVLSLMKLARFAAVIPVTVVEGMLASIGLLIIVKQLPTFFGVTHKTHAHEFFELIRELPDDFRDMTPAVFGVALATLTLLFVLDSMRKYRLFRLLPPQLIAVIVGVMLGQAAQLGTINPAFLIKLPENLFHGAHFPDFAGLFSRHDLWQAAIVAVVMLTMIDGVESLATAMAVDRIDPFQRTSDTNRVLLAMGVSNIASSMVGGLTIIPGGVKSKVNVAAGGRTLWANATNSICLVLYLVLGASLIHLIPLGVLAAVLIFTGWKMCEPFIWIHMARIGKEQLLIFSLTVVATLLTDLLWGIAIGVAAEFLMNVFFCRNALVIKRAEGVACPTLGHCACDFFRNPVEATKLVGDVYTMILNKPIVCFNVIPLSEELDKIPREAKRIRIELGEQVTLIDHTAAENLMHLVRESSHGGRSVEVVGLEAMKPLSNQDACVRVARPLVRNA